MQNEESFFSSTFFSKSDFPPGSPTFKGQPGLLPPDKNHSVLIFSFEKETLLLLKTLLQIRNYRIEESDSLESVLATVKNRRPNLILMDLLTPFEVNPEILRQIRKNKFCQEIPIIQLSGFSEPLFRSLSLAVGANDFFVKPVDFDSLKNCLRKNIENHQGRTQ